MFCNSCTDTGHSCEEYALGSRGKLPGKGDGWMVHILVLPASLG